MMIYFHYIYYRLMSFVVAVALNIVAPNHRNRRQIFDLLVLPDFIKGDTGTKFKAYFQAILLNGYRQQKVRKITVLGNKGKYWYLNLLVALTPEILWTNHEMIPFNYFRSWKNEFLCIAQGKKGWICQKSSFLSRNRSGKYGVHAPVGDRINIPWFPKEDRRGSR